MNSITLKKWHYQRANDIDDVSYPNIITQDFRTTSSNQKWYPNITYIHTKADGYCYLPNIQNLYFCKIIVHQLSRHMMADLVISALQQALETRKVTNKSIVYTELCGQYRSAIFEKILTKHHILHPYS